MLATDRDNDGASDDCELVAVTCPTRHQSVVKLANATVAVSGDVPLQWPSASNRFYSLQRGTNLQNSTSFSNVVVDTASTPPLNTFTDLPPAGSPAFCRIRVRQ